MAAEYKIDQKEAGTMERRSVADDTDYCTMRPGQGDNQWSQAGEDMASLISFDSLQSSSGSGSARTDRHMPANDLDPTLASLFRSSLSDEDILSTLIQWTGDTGEQGHLTPRYRQGCLPYLINLLHLHPIHTEAARPTRHIRQVFVQIFVWFSIV